ncbi:M28 family metallopeptidase [Labilibaculum sp.]|uniref:M28 family metallopeptidase n=1 Tax=Labilibaculum sp. TaxID=2060723 RepID=UPI003562EF0E
MIKRITLLASMGLFCFQTFAQDMDYTKALVTKLSSPEFHGRGYVNKGDSIAAAYLSAEMKSIGLKGFSHNYYQPYTTPINTYPENPRLSLDGKELESASEYIVNPNAKSCEGESEISWITKDILTDQRKLSHFMREDHSNAFLAIDSTGLHNKELYNFAQAMLKKNVFDAKGIVLIDGKLKFSARTKTVDYTTFMLKSEVITPEAKKISYNIKSKFIADYHTQNLVGYLPGKTDSCLIFSAHYDHLGHFGDKMFPGANDNASGVAMVMNLAKHFKSLKKKPHYTLVFALFSGEEAGLLGSTYYSENPLIPLAKTKMLMNFDMVATGSKGIFVINGKMVPDEMAKFNAINKEKDYVFKMSGTGESASSDHAPFHEKGVKALFFYTHGDNADYHETTDTADKLPYTQFEGIFKLVRDYVEMK